ncbi:DUF4339 domain-containing protein [Rhizobium leguminosarum]|uniref:DUF4339 domain-containing protein n=1 Tax=Rhizobium leguminosarum TaxID=384 RepID=UPI000B92AF20|nr:DUF4339 domain-containing protein [Rhizobium leguminosarum]ASS56893.1 hypothetical protein CHR56_21345 [Rhizobium leguminosarum bv. viciae]
MSDWHYTANGSTVGPVSGDELTRLYKAGKINEGTLVWNAVRAGEWAEYRTFSELHGTSGPPPLPTSMINDTWIWAMALVPAIGLLIERAFASGSHLGMQPEAWAFLYAITYLVLVALDGDAIRQSGRRQQVGTIWPWALLLPAYLYVRARRLGKPYYTLLTWIAGSALAVYASLQGVTS